MTSQDNFEATARNLAAQYLGRIEPSAELHSRYIEALDAYYFYQEIRGGRAIIVGRDNSALFATSAVDPAEHEKAYAMGRRTDPATFDQQ